MSSPPQAARQRLAFQELLALQLKLLVQRNLAWWVESARRRGRHALRAWHAVNTCGAYLQSAAGALSKRACHAGIWRRSLCQGAQRRD